jgi:hypothetical protein
MSEVVPRIIFNLSGQVGFPPVAVCVGKTSGQIQNKRSDLKGLPMHLI